MDSEHHRHIETETRWLCHVCHYSSAKGNGYVCQRCYKITCGEHITPLPAENETGSAKLEMVCVECLAQERDEA
ncbi:MAG: hypothetical protein ACOC0G_00340 [Thermodesulfobacteriota bacterium]